jgi:hypothetical protein
LYTEWVKKKEQFGVTIKKEVFEHKVVCYVSRGGVTTLSCPQCGASKTIDTSKKDYAFKSFKAKCKCGARIRGQFEFRQYFRKKVNLPGAYRHRETGVQGKILIDNLSLMGVGFTCLRKHNFQEGDHLDLTFTLDNERKSKVTLWVVVGNIRDRFVGAKRQDPSVSQPDLGFYLK